MHIKAKLIFKFTCSNLSAHLSHSYCQEIGNS